MRLKLSFNVLLWVAICCARVCMATESNSENGAFSVISVDMGEGCAIGLINYYGGRLKSGMPNNSSYWTDVSPVRNSSEKFHINFECLDNRPAGDVANDYGAQWDAGRKRWISYYEDDDEKRLASPVSKIYQLKAVNARGFMRTTDQINGEESQRVRFYSFCLFYGAKAVCGSGQSMKLEEPKEDFLPYILRILRSVTFIDGPSARE